MPDTSKHTVLIVDDEPEILYSLRGLLRHDFDVLTATSAYEAMNVLRRQPVHVIMTDQRMPETTGVEFLNQVRGVYPEAIRLIFTGYADIKAVIDAINRGSVYRYLTKPWDPDDLQAVLHQAAAEHDRRAERQRVLAELLDYREECRRVQEGLAGGRLGTLTPEGQAELTQLAATGQALYERLQRALGRKR
jgi:response regulator RpfG family c-di-GMP phosphodiesterase